MMQASPLRAAACAAFLAVSAGTAVAQQGATQYQAANLIAVDSDKGAMLTWQPVPGVDRFEVQRRLGISATAKSKPFTTVARDVEGAQFEDKRLRNGTPYYYQLVGVDKDGNTVTSNPAKATPVAPVMPGAVLWPLSRKAEADADGIAYQYGPRFIGRSYDFHAGIDIPAPIGTPVYPVMDGEVTAIDEWNGKRGPGNRVLINHGSQRWTAYLHLDAFAPDLQVGQKVIAGETEIGVVGKTGANSEHLHLTYMVGLQSEKGSEMRSKNPLEILPHTPPADIAIDFKPDNIVVVTLPTQHMTARWVQVEGDGKTRLLDYYQVVEQGSKNRDAQRQFGLFLETTGLASPLDARSKFTLKLRPDEAEPFKIERVTLIDFHGQAIASAQAPQ